MTKSEFYKSSIQLHKKCGQGISGIVKLGSDSNIRTYIDELIKEGLLIACDTGGSLGHPESNIFYMPTKGYNVWEDNGTDGKASNYKGRYLQMVRFYLGALEKEHNPDASVNEKILSPTMTDAIRNVSFMEEYAKWLKRNENDLKDMLSIDEVYYESEIILTQDEIERAKKYKWYKENLTIKECIKASTKGVENVKERISINKKLVDLYKMDLSKYSESLNKSESEILKDTSDVEFRIHRLNRWLSTKDESTKVQDIY